MKTHGFRFAMNTDTKNCGEVTPTVFLKLKPEKRKLCVKYLQDLQGNIQYRTVPYRILGCILPGLKLRGWVIHRNLNVIRYWYLRENLNYNYTFEREVGRRKVKSGPAVRKSGHGPTSTKKILFRIRIHTDFAPWIRFRINVWIADRDPKKGMKLAKVNKYK